MRAPAARRPRPRRRPGAGHRPRTGSRSPGGRAAAGCGSHLVLGPRTGYADHEARARHETAPPRLVAAAGAWYDEFGNLPVDLPLRTVPGSPLALAPGATATRWMEGLTTTDATEPAGCAHPHFGRWSAVTTRAHGSGRVTCVGTVPGRELASWLAPAPVGGWRDLPASVTATTGTAPDGRRVHVVHNWSWQPALAQAPAHLTNALGGASVPAGGSVSLGAWDVRVFVAS
ncbi:beta-galactosidase trimerization domain-containing protein [Streptomyces sp. NPDC098789]|uniref:beta-galactosidase trimerization domain-containing protein n=1 Tax=Streptomyces sp. NPDC098789 TaxID=3366098 RepID=UPI00381DCF72